jgi:hypothetical protein
MDEMIGVLMASAADGQNRPARADVSAIVRGSLLERVRGPRGGWSFALSAFALVAPLFLILTDILQVAFPSSESQAAVQSRIGALGVHGVPAAGRPVLAVGRARHQHPDHLVRAPGAEIARVQP